METLSIYPSEIRFSQNNISNQFSGALWKEYIGVVVDKIYNGDADLKLRVIGNMQIGRWNQSGYENMWFAVNNRSLWVLKQLQTIGKLNEPIVLKIIPNGIDQKRFSTKNKGTCVVVRTQPVGGTKSVPAPFWEYKQIGANVATAHAMVGNPATQMITGGGYSPANLGSFMMGGYMAGYDDDDNGYDSDEYYYY